MFQVGEIGNRRLKVKILKSLSISFRYWWRNLLFINNFYPLSEMCMSWSWYLSVDFQCFTIGTIILVIWTNNKWIASAIFSVIFMAATFYNGYMGYILNYQFSLDVEFETINILYTSLWSRICGYFCGIICGWYLSTYERKMKLSKVIIERISKIQCD